MSFTSPGKVKTVGGLQDSSVAGHVKDAQIDAAIIYAELQMRKLSLITGYDTVLAYDDSSTAAQKTQKKMYEQAESCYALSRLPNILTSSQLAATGLVKTFEIGKESRSFASQKEKDEIASGWVKQAIDALMEYLSVSLKDDAGEVEVFIAKNQRVSVMSI